MLQNINLRSALGFDYDCNVVLLCCSLKEKDNLQNEILNKKKTLIYKKNQQIYIVMNNTIYTRTRTHSQTLTESKQNSTTVRITDTY